MGEGRAEQLRRANESSVGQAVVRRPSEINSSRPEDLGCIFLIDKIKRDVADPSLDPSVYDDEIEGRPFKVLNIALKDVPGSLIARYWIDLRRSGHAVRVESYLPGRVMIGRLNITLASFKVGDAEVWMPVSGEQVGYAALVDKKPVATKEPTSVSTIHVNSGTMQFNRRPGPEAFTIKYKIGTPISDSLRKLTFEYGQQNLGSRPTKAEVEKMLVEQVAKAEEQKTELVVASPSQGLVWWPWMVAAAGAVVVSLVALKVQRRR
jgi:hypothetical protein